MKKNIEWLKNEVNELPLSFLGFSVLKQREEFGVKKDDVLDLIDQLDEPEVLSQELPVIPKFVADYIDDRKEVGFPIYQAIRIVRENSRFEHSHLREWLWTNKGQEAFVRAWLDGYTVEKEPLYRARLKVITDEFIASYLRTQSSDAEDRLKALEIGSKYIHEDYRHLSEFTEDELKRLDIWDSEQWEVEELEE